MATREKRVQVTDPSGNPILTQGEGDSTEQPAPPLRLENPERKGKAEKPKREPIPTDPRKFKIRHVTRLVGIVERAWALVPEGVREVYRPIFLQVFARHQADIEERVKP